MNRRSFLTLAAASTLVAQTQGRAEAKKYRTCVIGDTNEGGYGHNLHLLWNMRDDVEVVGLADPDAGGRAKHAAECGAERTYADYREMLAKEKPDIVTVGPRCTNRHAEYLLACAEAGAHGIIEKPLAADLAEADEVIAAMKVNNLKWSIALNYRMSPITAHVKKAVIEDKVIGDILELRGRGKEDHRAGGEDIIVLGTHVFDLMIYILGRPEWCHATVLTDGRPSTPADVHEATEPLGPIVGNQIRATYGFANGTPGYFASVKNPEGNQNRWGLDIHGTKGIVTIRMEPIPKVHLLRDGTWSAGFSGAAWEVFPGLPEVNLPDNPAGYYKPLVDDLIAAIEEDRAPECSLSDGRNALEMAQAIFQAATQPDCRIGMPLERRAHPLANWT